MPRKRRLAKTRRVEDELFPGLVDVLLVGWGGTWQSTDGDYTVFDYTEDDLRAFWQKYRDRLMGLWQHRGGVGHPWAAQRFEETR